MAVVTRKRAHGVTYYVTFDFDGVKQWEHAGSDKTEAHRLSRRRLREVAAGTYRPERKSEHPTVREFAEEWLSKRTCRWAEDEATFFRTYVLSREWLAGMLIEDLEVRHTVQLATELKTAWSERFQRTIAATTAATIYGIYSVMCRDARIDGVLKTDVCVLPRGLLQRRAKKSKRKPYSAEAVAKILGCAAVHPTARVFSTLAFLTGMREGEICGRRWRDWDPGSSPLGCLTVETQYNDQMLKGDHFEPGEVARRVPVHPELARVLTWWQSEGFAIVHRRAPTLDDFIVPNEHGEPYGRSAAYALFQRAIAKAGVENLTLHATRNTFTSLCRRGGARKEVIEQVTHNASGDTVDHYTYWDWAPLCEAVLCLQLGSPTALALAESVGGDASGDVRTNDSRLLERAPGVKPGTSDESTRAYLHSSRIVAPLESSVVLETFDQSAREGAARHQSAQAFVLAAFGAIHGGQRTLEALVAP